MGLDRLWRRRTRQAIEPQPGERILDLAAGTGVSTAELADRTSCRPVACDFSLGMLRAGRARKNRRTVPFVAGDALHLPFPDGVFDAVTITFGLRNVADPDTALREMARVVRPGGRLVVCEFSRPRFAPFRFVYTRYLLTALPLIARVVSSNADAYDYLAESIRAWPRSGRTGAAHRRQRMDRRAMAQPDRRGRRTAPCAPDSVSAAAQPDAAIPRGSMIRPLVWRKDSHDHE